MKTKSIFLTTSLIFCLGAMPVFSQNKSIKKSDKKEIVKEVIESGTYKIEVSMAYPRRGRNVPLTSSYNLEVRNDSVISYLPFYGRAYSIPYGGGDGLIFKAPLDEYDVNYNAKKKKYEITLKARTKEDTFRFTLDIFSNGSSRVNVNMQNRESISFAGELDLLSF